MTRTIKSMLQKQDARLAAIEERKEKIMQLSSQGLGRLEIARRLYLHRDTLREFCKVYDVHIPKTNKWKSVVN